jgi:hypothetical protein
MLDVGHEEALEDKRYHVEFTANPTQRRFIEHRPETHKARCADIFNSRLGEGKSAALVWSILFHTRANPGARWALVRDTFENLQKSTMIEFFEWFPDGIFGTYHKGRKLWTWNPEIAKGEVMFIGMDDEKSATKIQSVALAGFAIDEVSPVSGSAGVSRHVFTTLYQRLRQKGMNYYVGKLAQNNPDESHWTYKEFIDPGAEERFNFQTGVAENMANLPPGYYDSVEKSYEGQEDKIRRFVKGEFGFIKEGAPVTPQWSDRMHLADRLTPMRKRPLHLGWDFGLNATCVISQVTPIGHWNILDAFVGESGTGVLQLINDVVKPRLIDRYSGFYWEHTGDPAGSQRAQSDSDRSAVKVLKAELGGTWRPGPVAIQEREIPLQAVLSRSVEEGRGVVQVDREHAKAVWHALRGGWHRRVAPGGVVAATPVKDIHSHPGDVMGYLASRLFPVGRLGKHRKRATEPATASFFSGVRAPAKLTKLPKHGESLKTLPTRRRA